MMEANIQIFNNPKFGEVRVTEIDGKTYFVGSDVAKALGYERPNDAITQHCRYTVKHRISDNQGVPHEYLVIPEGDLYRLAAKSQLPAAEDFESWIFDDVLPSIRKHGAYVTPATIDAIISDPEFGIKLLSTLKEERQLKEAAQQRVQMLEGEKELLEKENRQLVPKAAYTDRVLQSTATHTMTEVAKELGMSAIALEKKLHASGVMFKQSGRWMLYAKYQGNGYTKPRTHHYFHSDGTAGTSTITVWTETGRAFVHQIMKKVCVAGTHQNSKLRIES
jgi:prophage antirepressor-like protein